MSQKHGLEDNTPIKQICEAVEEAHAQIQADFDHINPVVGVINRMRNYGIPTDLMTIDCLKSGRRILIAVHDNKPGIADYQFCRRDEDPADEFASIAASSAARSTPVWPPEMIFIIYDLTNCSSGA
ncbi:hypothetical protein Ga0123462_1041 [Mariprofundus ferrinatatus]|uniref:Uncharacterized protein n=1 Tax=Mariprofundus ferrinatatus TaxID=1921087 RepID=A0A2K8L3J6_9PROT|nr:hypothetical protein [Mariprofundus ferrinatatus]ATX81908.1 hypothetical protein Ga0123462_1041 [Mariprofundus ferrinatatus]